MLADTGTGFHITQRTLTLTGGVVVSLPVSGAPVWSYPNIHGDITWTADAAGARTGFFQYDPFGQPIDPVSKVIGSAVADESIPDTMPGNFDPGWVGSKGKGYEHAGSIAIIEMGVRMYSPWLGRFLAADPVAGGNTSWYNYPNDPINMFDLDGKMQDCGICNHGNYRGARPSPSAADHRDAGRSTRSSSSGAPGGGSVGRVSGIDVPSLAGAALRSMMNAFPTLVGLSISNYTGGTCRIYANTGNLLCTDVGAVGVGSGLTLGDTILTGSGSRAVQADFLLHESRHSEQWAANGAFFLPGYLAQGIASCDNRYEQAAGPVANSTYNRDCSWAK